jgi:competence protein ComEC
VPAAVGWSATAVAEGAPGAAGPAALAAAGIAVLAAGAPVLLGSRRRRILRRAAPDAAWGRMLPLVPILAVGSAVAALLLGSASLREPGRHPELLEHAAADHDLVVADVLLDETPVPVQGGSSAAGRADPDTARVRVTGRVTVLHVGSGDPGAAVDGRVALSAPVPVVVLASLDRRNPDAAPRIGATVRVVGAVRTTDPGDRAAYLLLARGGIRTVAEPTGPVALAGDLRAALSLAAAQLPGPGAELLPGLAIGDVSAVSPVLAQTMKDSSLTHLTAVSGANCAVVVGLVLAVAALAGWRRRGRAVAAVAALVAFVLLVTPQPSVLRAAVMAAVLIASTAGGRPSRGVPALALAVVALLAADPWLARDIGFALSVLATAGLLVLAPPVAARLACRMPLRVARMLAVPIAAQVACQPVLLILQPGLPVHGVVANLLAEPAAAPATIGGLAACLLLPVWPAAGAALLRLAWLPSCWIAAVASVTATLPAGRIPWPEGAAGAVALAAATALAVAAAALGRDGPTGSAARVGDDGPGG